VRVELVRFGPQPGGEVSLSGRFVLLPVGSERALVTRAVELRRDPAPGPDDPGPAVEAMSALLADLAGQIADAIAALPPDPSEKSPSSEAVLLPPR
jgi:ABC-type transport auxiliary lipoprotein component